jgi:hypothetical protein
MEVILIDNLGNPDSMNIGKKAITESPGRIFPPERATCCAEYMS